MKASDDIKSFLSDNYNLSDIEVSLYISLLKRGPSTIMDLANFADVNRATTHINVETLIKKGLIVQSRKANTKRRIVIAEKPDKLGSILNNRKMQIEKAQVVLPDIVKNLSALLPEIDSRSGIEIEYFENKKEVKNIYKKVLEANEIRSYVNLDKVSEMMPDNGPLYIEAHKKNKKMKIWSIVSSADPKKNVFQKSMDNKRYFCKYLKNDTDISLVDFLIFDDYIAYITVEEQTKGVIIKNKYIQQHSEAIHKLVWSLL